MELQSWVIFRCSMIKYIPSLKAILLAVRQIYFPSQNMHRIIKKKVGQKFQLSRDSKCLYTSCRLATVSDLDRTHTMCGINGPLQMHSVWLLGINQFPPTGPEFPPIADTGRTRPKLILLFTMWIDYTLWEWQQIQLTKYTFQVLLQLQVVLATCWAMLWPRRSVGYF
jgi:hypothetical protein